MTGEIKHKKKSVSKGVYQMDEQQRIDAAKNLLDLLMSFFSRVESKASVILGIDTGMLAVLATTAPPTISLGWRTVTIAIISALLIFISLAYLLLQLLPQLKGGEKSLIYFREIATREEQQFIEKFLGITGEAYVKDLLSQVWRNSQILERKFFYLNRAFFFLGTSLIPWLITLYLFSDKNAQLKALAEK